MDFTLIELSQDHWIIRLNNQFDIGFTTKVRIIRMENEFTVPEQCGIQKDIVIDAFLEWLKTHQPE